MLRRKEQRCRSTRGNRGHAAEGLPALPSQATRPAWRSSHCAGPVGGVALAEWPSEAMPSHPCSGLASRTEILRRETVGQFLPRMILPKVTATILRVLTRREGCVNRYLIAHSCWRHIRLIVSQYPFSSMCSYGMFPPPPAPEPPTHTDLAGCIGAQRLHFPQLPLQLSLVIWLAHYGQWDVTSRGSKSRRSHLFKESASISPFPTLLAAKRMESHFRPRGEAPKCIRQKEPGPLDSLTRVEPPWATLLYTSTKMKHVPMACLLPLGIFATAPWPVP